MQNTKRMKTMDQADEEFVKRNSLVLSAKEAAYLITKRESLGKLSLSIKGTITALSDVIRVGRNLMFLVEVDTCLILVVKDFHIEWHPELEPGALFVFHNLRLTTLEKGISKPCSVFFILATSSFQRQTDESAVIPISLQQWLKKKNMNILLEDETLGHDVNCENGQGLINYEGTVTSTENASSGIFVLDDRIRLISLSSNAFRIKKHSRVFVYNAHLIKEGCLLYLVCCMKSCIRILGPVLSACVSSTSTGEYEDSTDNKVRIFIQNVIRKYELNFVEITALLNLHSKLIRLGISKSSQENLFACFVKSFACVGLVKSSVKETDIFIQHSQLCSLNQSQTHECRIPQVVDLSSLREDILEMQSALNSDNSCLDVTVIQFQSSPHHLTLCSSNGKVLVGQLIICPEGMVFKDATDQLRMVILSESEVQPAKQNDVCGSDEHPGPSRQMAHLNSHHQPHLCCQCCFSPNYPGTQLMCPILDPWIIGKNICVRRFYTVIESYHSSRTQGAGGSGGVSNDDVFVYLAFSLLDCVFMDNCPPPSVCSFSATECSNYLSSTSSSDINLRRVRKCENEFTCLMYVNEKQPLTYTGNQFSDTQTCQFRILGSIIDPDLETVKAIRCCQSCVVKSKQSKVCVLENAASRQNQISLPDYSKQNTSQQTPKFTCASFLEVSAKWFSCISNGHLYKFTSGSKSNVDLFTPTFSRVKLQKVAENRNVVMTIEMPEDLVVERLPLALSDSCRELGNAQDELLRPVSLILSDSFSETIVSFCGVIISRDFAASFTADKQKQGLKSPSMTNIKLEVKEMATHKNDVSSWLLTVYLDSPRAVYTLGLVPGAVVKFHRVERKVSQVGNIYCRFIAISVAEVVKFSMRDSPRSRFLMSETQNIPLEDMSRELLINIWQGKLEHSQRENQTFRIHCHIDKIFKLSIKNLCSRCKSVYLKQGCRRCGHLTFPIPVSNAVLLVEDGTCPATVNVWSSDLVRQLLALTRNQWQDLVTEVLVYGEVLIESSSPPSSTIDMFLRALIGSSLILRPCKMAVKRSKGSIFSTFDKMTLEDFQENEVKVGKHYLKTLSLPRMKLECLMISDIDS